MVYQPVVATPALYCVVPNPRRRCAREEALRPSYLAAARGADEVAIPPAKTVSPPASGGCPSGKAIYQSNPRSRCKVDGPLLQELGGSRCPIPLAWCRDRALRGYGLVESVRRGNRCYARFL